VISQQEESMQLPIMLGMPQASVTMSALILLGAAAVFCTVVAIGFKHKKLGDLC
jgi:hypothetical protein